VFAVTKMMYSYHKRKENEKLELLKVKLAEQGRSLPLAPKKKKKVKKIAKMPSFKDLNLSAEEITNLKIKAFYHTATESESDEANVELTVTGLPDYELDD
jgi:hypothetical protein